MVWPITRPGFGACYLVPTQKTTEFLISLFSISQPDAWPLPEGACPPQLERYDEPTELYPLTEPGALTTKSEENTSSSSSSSHPPRRKRSKLTFDQCETKADLLKPDKTEQNLFPSLMIMNSALGFYPLEHVIVKSYCKISVPIIGQRYAFSEDGKYAITSLILDRTPIEALVVALLSTGRFGIKGLGLYAIPVMIESIAEAVHINEERSTALTRKIRHALAEKTVLEFSSFVYCISPSLN